MIAIHEERLQQTIDHFKNDIDSHIKAVLSILQQHIADGYWSFRDEKNKKDPINFNVKEKEYLEYLHSNLSGIVLARPTKISNEKLHFDTLIDETYRKHKPNGFVKFKDRLIGILGYGILRSDKKRALYPQFFEHLGIKTCVYCNSQLAVTVDNFKKQKKSAKFEVDHYLPKSDYPCFSISFYNLYPVCSSCNGSKSSNDLKFSLYSITPTEISTSHFEFELDKKSIAKFRLSFDESELEIEFKDKNNTSFDETFAITGIYNTQKDLAAEIIVKALIYNKTYKESLQKSFAKLYSKNPINFNRIILGNYPDVKDIHKRPLAKFSQDIARQLKLIK